MIRGPDRDPWIVNRQSTLSSTCNDAGQKEACKTADSGSHVTLVGSDRRVSTIINVSAFYLSIFVEWSPPCHFRIGSSVLPELQDELPATNSACGIRPLQAELSDNTLACMRQTVLCSIG